MMLVRGFGTLVAIFETRLQAKLIANKFKRRGAEICKNRAATPFMNKELAELHRAVERTHPKTTKKQYSYQELTVAIELPHDLSLKTVPPVLNTVVYNNVAYLGEKPAEKPLLIAIIKK
jgi:hypothetical protein